MRWKWIALAAFVGGLRWLVAAARREAGTRPLRGDSWPRNFAHRGASARAPENTLEAFRQAVASGAGGLELDVHMTLDGEIVVIHDPTVDRTTEGSGEVAGITSGELRRLDAGYRFSPDGGSTYPYRGTGLRVPTLAEVYEAFPEACVNIEIKEAQPGVEGAVLRVVRGAGAQRRTLVASHDHRVITRFRELCGREAVPTGASRREIAAFYLLRKLGLEALVRPRYDALQVPVEHRGLLIVTRRFVEAAHRQGVRVDAWTINRPQEMRQLLDLGVDTIMTDDPDALETVLRSERAPSAHHSSTTSAEATPKSV